MPGRTHAERLAVELDVIRKELIHEIRPLPPEELDWSPQPGMKSYRKILVEIGVTEWASVRLLRAGQLPPDEDARAVWDEIERGGSTSDSLLKALEVIRRDMLDYLKGTDEERLQTPVPLPEEWRFNFGGVEEIEPEELVREIARHEYYHLGQMITYRWIQGHNPYGSG